VKPRKRSVSLVIEEPRGLLLVRRPDDDESLPGVWGLPAVSLEPGEREEDAVLRAGRAKLGVDVRPLAAIGEGEAGRAGYVLAMRDWRVRIASGEPEVPQPGRGTQYVELRWGEVAELVPAARAGSLCCRVLLRERGIDWEA
jgi:8-oxo-dGTP diphosphatase